MAEDRRSHRIGLILVALCALFWSSAGLFTRFISADLMTMLFWRGIFSGTAVFLLFFALERGNALAILKRMRLPSLGVAFFSAMGMVTGIGAYRFTTVADAMVIYATVPFVTAGMAYLLLGEKPTRSTLIAAAVALVGVAIMLWGSPWGGSLIGKGLAVLMTLSMASFTTIMRGNRDVPMLPAMGASAWLCSAFCFFLAHPFRISGQDFWLSAAFGVIQNAMGLALYTFGSRRVPAAEATLLAALEVPFTPFWVWLVLGETPDTATLIGGAIVLSALFGHILMEFRGNRQADPEPFRAG